MDILKDGDTIKISGKVNNVGWKACFLQIEKIEKLQQGEGDKKQEKKEDKIEDKKAEGGENDPFDFNADD